MGLFYNIINVNAVNAFMIWQQLQGENSNNFSEKKRNFLISLGKKLAESQALTSISARHVLKKEKNSY